MNTNTTPVTQSDALAAIDSMLAGMQVLRGFVAGGSAPVTVNAAGRAVDPVTKRYVAARVDVKAPAKVPAKAPKATKAPKAGKAKARKVSNAQCDQEGLSRKDWNNAVSKLTRSMGQHASGVSVYRFVMDRWTAQIVPMRGKVTPRMAVEAVLGA